MLNLLNNFYLALPDVIVLITACLALLGDLFFKRKAPYCAYIIACVGLVLAFLVNSLFIGQPTRLLFNGLIMSDDVSQLMKLFIELTVLLSFVYSVHYIHMCKMPLGDYIVLGLFSTVGMMTLVSAHSLLTIYLGLELLSLPLYAMTAIQRNRAIGAEAAIKYIVMGAIASGLLLYGFSLLYGVTGEIDLQAIAHSLANSTAHEYGLLAFALVFIVAGVGFKMAAVPFHMWVPDVYAGAPSSVTLFISAAPKIAGVAMVLRIMSIAIEGSVAQWQPLLLCMALLSTGIGNVLALVQQDLKRLLAYSAIAHMGYALFGVVAATPEGYAAALYYALIYALMSSAAFGLLVLLSRDGIEITSIDDLKGLNKRSPWLAFMMMIVLLSMAGVPPMVGFLIKFAVLKALVNVQLLWAATLGVIFAVIGAFYYLKLIKIMYFDDINIVNTPKIPVATTIIFSLNCLALLYFGLLPNTLMIACVNAFS